MGTTCNSVLAAVDMLILCASSSVYLTTALEAGIQPDLTVSPSASTTTDLGVTVDRRLVHRPIADSGGHGSDTGGVTQTTVVQDTTNQLSGLDTTKPYAADDATIRPYADVLTQTSNVLNVTNQLNVDGRSTVIGQLATGELSDVTDQMEVDGPRDLPGQSTADGPSDVTGQQMADGPNDVTGQSTADGPSDVTGQQTADGPNDVTGQPSTGEPSDVISQQTVDGPSDATGQPSTGGPSDVISQQTVDGPSDVTGQPTADGPSDVTDQLKHDEAVGVQLPGGVTGEGEQIRPLPRLNVTDILRMFKFNATLIHSGSKKNIEIEMMMWPDTLPEIAYSSAAVFGVLGVLGNGLLLAIANNVQIRQFSYSVYLCALSIADTLGLAVMYVDMILVTRRTPWAMLTPSPRTCGAVLLVNKFFTAISPWLQLCFSCDRLLAVRFPLKRKMLCTVRNARLACLAVSLVCMVVCLPEALLTEQIPMGGRMMCATVDKTLLRLYPMELTLITLFPCACLLCVNAYTLTFIKRAIRGRRHIRSQEERGDHSETRKATVSLLTLPMYAVLVMVPFVVVHSAMTVALISPTYSTAFKLLMEFGLMDVEPYVRILYTTSFVMNVYLLLATSSSYRRIARDILRLP